MNHTEKMPFLIFFTVFPGKNRVQGEPLTNFTQKRRVLGELNDRFIRKNQI